MKITLLLTWLCVVGSSIGLSASAENSFLPARPFEESKTLPLEAQYAVSAALGKDQTAYHVLPNREWRATRHKPPCDAPRVINPEPLNHAGTSYQAANPNQHFDARFDAQGASVVSGGTHWDLSVRAWGYGDPDYAEASTELDRVGDLSCPASLLRQGSAGQAVVRHPSSVVCPLLAPCVSANRVEYRRGALTEWYVNGPLGLQQGFTVQAPPARNATHNIAGGPTRNNGPGRGPLTFVLNLPDGEGHSQVDADRTGLTLLTDSLAELGQAAIGGSASGGKNGPALRYSGLTAFDADGVRLPAWLETQNHDHAQRVVKLLLRVDDTKARYPLTIDPFIQQAKLTAADGAASDNFGRSMALSGDGNTAIAGAYYADVGGNADQGAAYVFTRSGAAWNLQAKLTAADGAVDDYFGISVALSSDGNTAIAGAYGADVGGNTNQGAAYVFTRAGAAWFHTSTLTAADGAASDFFGYSVTLNGYGHRAIVGAYGANVSGLMDQGAAYVFKRSGASWSQHWKLTAWDGTVDNYFGSSVALSSDGYVAIVGADKADVDWNINQGAAYVFMDLGDWVQQAKLTAADGDEEDHFGISVALSLYGNTAIVGAYGAAGVDWTFNSGAAYVFTRSGGWSQQAKLTAADGTAWDLFGRSVALSSDGNTACAGAYYADVGGNADQGAAYVFTRSGAAWSQQEKLTASDSAVYDRFGFKVALSSNGDTAIVGAYHADVGGNTNQGAAYVFALPPPPTVVAASYDFYIDRVQVTWEAAAGATGYEVWRGASNDTGQATNIAIGVTGTNYDDMAATAGTPYYYWVKTTNASGASAFSASAIGRVLLGPDVRLNGAAGPLTVAAGDALVVTMSMNPAQNAGYPADWWAAASTPFGLYYLNAGLAWTPASSLSALQPVLQGGLFAMQSTVALDTTALPPGTYTFAFGVDTLNGNLDPDVVYDNATVTVAP